MTYVILVRGSAYGPVDGVTFNAGEPKQVDDKLAQRLLSTGRFRQATQEDIDASQPAIPGLVHSTEITHIPLNIIGRDDLNGKRVLLRRAGALGDVVFVMQVAAYLRQRHPHVKISLAVNDGLVEFCQQFTVADEVVTVDASCTHAFLARCAYVITFNGVIEKHVEHTQNYFALHFERAGIIAETTPPVVPLLSMTEGADRVHAAREYLHSIGYEPGKYVVLLTGTSNALKTTTPTIMHRTMELLTAGKECGLQGALKVLCVSGPDDKFSAGEVRGWIHQTKGQALPVSAQLIADAACVVGGDTGMTHTAHALGVPTVSYWGPTAPANLLPSLSAPERSTAVIAKSPTCVPCRKTRAAYCPYFDGTRPDCMTQIVPEEIAAAVATHMQQERTEAPAPQQARPVLSVAQATTQFNPLKLNVAIPLEYADFFSGGGFYVWQLAKSFAERAGVDVWLLLTTRNPVYLAGATAPPADLHMVYDPNLEMMFGEGSTTRFDIVLGQPRAAGISAVKYAQQFPQAKAACIIYETPAYIAKYRNGGDTEESYWAEYKEALIAAHTVFVISDTVKEEVLAWDERLLTKKHFIQVVSPVVDSPMADATLGAAPERLLTNNRTNSVVLVSRNVSYKRMDHAVQVLANQFGVHVATPDNPFTIHIIGARASVVGNGLPLAGLAARNVLVRQHENCPEDVKWRMIREARAVVHSSEFEGFGIPLAEAMYAGTPVVAHELPVFKESFGQYPFYYTDDASLVRTLHTLWAAFDQPAGDPGRSRQRLERYLYDAWSFVNKRYTRAMQSSRMNVLFANYFKDAEAKAQRAMVVRNLEGGVMRLAMVTPWHNRCGIAETTEALFTAIRATSKVFAPDDADTDIVQADEAFVERCWNRSFESPSRLLQALLDFTPTVVHFQHEHSIYRDHNKLLYALKMLRERGVKTVATVHTIEPQSSAFQSMAAAVDRIVLTKEVPDMPSNAMVIPLPCYSYTLPYKLAARAELGMDAFSFVVGTFGMWNPHKGIREFLLTYDDVSLQSTPRVVYLVSGFSRLKNPYYRETRHQFVHRVDKGLVRMWDDYAPVAEVVRRIAACDLMVFNYNVDTHYSASASIRTAMSCGVPVICTNCKMFSEFTDGENVLKVPFIAGPEINMHLVEAINRVQTDESLRNKLTAGAQKYATDNGLAKVAKRHEKLYEKLMKE